MSTPSAICELQLRESHQHPYISAWALSWRGAAPLPPPEPLSLSRLPVGLSGCSLPAATALASPGRPLPAAEGGRRGRSKVSSARARASSRSLQAVHWAADQQGST